MSLIILQDEMSDILDNLKNAKSIDLDLIPRNPLVMFYDNNDTKFYESNLENDFYAIRLMIEYQDLKGYYFTVETEWWDDNGEYQGSVGKRNYKKYYFNVNSGHDLSDIPHDLFMFPFNVLCEINKIRK